ncbi:RidA family protein [Oceanidesulfovibrio indonesiensis]|uniref:RidA family protein n=1 Tax=Oceanidesulfovibrio indonesiensis TaxID=54767 RepID=A0A7M3MF17_9BACT|nr:RidA family protein [Oceanidesulfovibrio indonesiensis]TVM17609.1 RidA family protein [Oceanidesulfovibrio indonesiensis]
MQTVHTDKAPKAVGPYSQAVIAGGVAYCSGQLGLDPATMTLREGVEAQARQALANMAAVLEAAGSSPSRVVKATVFVADMADFPVVNGIYEEFFGEHKPARSTIQVAGLPLGGLVEMECVALTE